MKSDPPRGRVGPDVGEAARAVSQGGLVVYPTDTLYGLGARFDDEEAVRRVFEVKRRPLDQPLSLAVAVAKDVERYAEVTPLGRRLLGLLPGPLTVVLRKRPVVPDVLTGGQDAVGLRVPDHVVCQQLLRKTGPLTSTSANGHGEPDPTTLPQARRAFGDRVDYYLAGGTPVRGVPSTLVDARGRVPKILREGVLSAAQIREFLHE